MGTSLQHELDELIGELAPAFFDREELDRLVAIDNDSSTFDGECFEHDACRPVFARRLE